MRLALLILALILLAVGLIIFCLISYQALSASDSAGPLTDLQWWLLFSSIILIFLALGLLLFSDTDQVKPPGVVEISEVQPQPTYIPVYPVLEAPKNQTLVYIPYT